MQTDLNTSKTWRDRLKRLVRWALLANAAVMAVCVIVLIMVPPSWTYHEGTGQVVHIYPVWVFMLALYIGVSAAAAMFVLFIAGLIAGSRIEAVCSLIVAIYGIGGFLICGFAMSYAPWRLADTLGIPGGKTYALLTANGGGQYAIAEAVPDGWLSRRFVIRSIGDSRSLGRHLVRPVGSDISSDHLYLTTDEKVVVVQSWGNCIFLVDPEQDRVLDPSEFQRLSPFALLGPNDQPLPHDVKWLRSDPPAREELVSALDNPNPEVRKIARELIDKMVEDARQRARIARELIDQLDQDVRQQERAAKEREAKTQPTGR